MEKHRIQAQLAVHSGYVYSWIALLTPQQRQIFEVSSTLAVKCMQEVAQG
jgi:hypothetical protein